jgi:sialate O-acetylesterase
VTSLECNLACSAVTNCGSLGSRAILTNMPKHRLVLNSNLSVAALLGFLVLLVPPGAEAEPKLPYLFTDHMVLQRGMNVSVWGWADPEERIAVTLGANTRETITPADGHWNVSLPAMHAGGPFTLIVRGKQVVKVKDVLLGEVWIASGQSNMTYALSGATGAAEEIPSANYPQMRFFTVPKKIALTAQENTLPAAWEICTPDTAKIFSAVAYFFGRDLHKSLGVPIGIILSSWPGTAGEEWTDPDSLRREPVLQPIVQRWEAEPAGVKAFAAEPAEISLEFDDFELLPAAGSAGTPELFSNFDDGTSRTNTGGIWTYNWADAASTTFELAEPGRGGSGYGARVEGKLDGTSSPSLHASFKIDSSPADMSTFMGIRFWVRGQGAVQFQMLQPTISDWDNYSAEVIRAIPEWQKVTIWFKDLGQAGWGVVEPFTANALTGFVLNIMAPIENERRPPSGLYDGMIAPLEKYRIRGAIWYQGEGNTWRAEQYRTLLPSLIQGWRKGFGEPGFPFLIVQLPNLGTSPELGDSIWAELRDAQLWTAKTVPDTGLAVTIDVGDPKNLHPPRKAEIGERLTLWALGTTHERKIVYSGPIYDSMKISGNEVHIRFRYVGDGLEARGDALKGFSIAGVDRKFHWAEARIEGNGVVVSSKEVSAPAAARYAWANSPNCNLYNKNGLPASPFRTDDWPGASAGKR